MFISSAERINASCVAFFGFQNSKKSASFPPDDFDSESDCDSTVFETGLKSTDVLGLFIVIDIEQIGVHASNPFFFGGMPRLLDLTSNFVDGFV